jgi:hypothetical protein
MILSLRAYQKIRLTVNAFRKTLADDRVIVNEHDPRAICLGIFL